MGAVAASGLCPHEPRMTQENSEGKPTHGRWADLQTRVISAVVMLILGAAAIAIGGLAFVALIAFVVGGMCWELTRMIVPERAWLAPVAGVTAALILAFPLFLPELAILPGLIAALFARKDRGILLVYAALLMVSGMGLLALYAGQGLSVIVWLIAVVVATDIAGYFAGKSIGGRKFWPSISPKKTWAGILAGWLAAGIIGALMGGEELAFISVFMSFASQMGDIAESAIKRRAGVKDSSNLIPGHGGLLDRFDGLIAANLVVVIALLGVGMGTDLHHIF